MDNHRLFRTQVVREDPNSDINSIRNNQGTVTTTSTTISTNHNDEDDDDKNNDVAIGIPLPVESSRSSSQSQEQELSLPSSHPVSSSSSTPMTTTTLQDDNMTDILTAEVHLVPRSSFVPWNATLYTAPPTTFPLDVQVEPTGTVGITTTTTTTFGRTTENDHYHNSNDDEEGRSNNNNNNNDSTTKHKDGILFNPNNRIYWIMALGMTLLIFLLATVLLSLFFNGNVGDRHGNGNGNGIDRDSIQQNNNNNNNSTSSGGSGIGTIDNDIDYEVRLEEFTAILVEEQVATFSTFVDPTSPQSKALSWLVYEDETWLHPRSFTTASIGNNHGKNSNDNHRIENGNDNEDENGTTPSFLPSVSKEEEEEEEDQKEDPSFRKRLLRRYALMVFAYSTNVDFWTISELWTDMTRVDECSFWGIECQDDYDNDNDIDNDGGSDGIVNNNNNIRREQKIVSLNLDRRRLSGSIPNELGSILTHLTSLSLSRNTLTGSIPEGLYDMTDLETLSLYSNFLESTISTRLANLSNLKMLQLTTNPRLEGTFPSELLRSSFTKLEHLEISQTLLDWPVMDVILSWPNMTHLGYDYQQQNPLEGWQGTTPATSLLPTAAYVPTEISNLKSLEVFVVRGMYPSIPSEIGILTNLRFFGFIDPIKLSEINTTSNNDNDDNGSPTYAIPTELGNLENLKDLGFTGNHNIKGSIPTEIGNLSRLERLTLQDSSFTGTLPSELGQLSALKRLQISSCHFFNENSNVPTELGNLADTLESFTLVTSNHVGSLPEQFCYSDFVMVYLACEELNCDCCQRLQCYSS